MCEDAAYSNITGAPGPMNNVRWAPEGSASLAKRAEMLEIDREMSAAWLAAMEKLMLLDLTDAEFTAERMLRLKRWTTERKRRQHNLHFKYDPTRRKPQLVNRDVARQMAKARAQLEAIWTLRPELAPEDWKSARDEVALALESSPERALTARQRPPHVPDHRVVADALPKPSSEGLRPHQVVPNAFEDMVRADIGIVDLNAATDKQILDAYATQTNTPEAAARWYLAKLRGRPLPALLAD